MFQMQNLLYNVNLQSTKERLKKLNLEIPCLTSSCYLFDKADIDFYLKEGQEYIDLAQKLGTPFVRVLGDRNPEPGERIDVDFVERNLSNLAKYADGKGVKILIETNGVFANSDVMQSLIRKIGSSNIGVLWDVHHPFRFMNESVEKTYSTLKDYIGFVRVKDSVNVDEKVKYRMMGYGDVPVGQAISLLKDGGYNGYVSLEWVKRWCIDLEEPGVVFSHFINYMRNLI